MLYPEPIRSSQLEDILVMATGQAVYSARQMLKYGFLTMAGGHRLGICGTAIYTNGELHSLKEISSINLRVASEKRGFSMPAVNYIWTHPRSALIVGPPGSGKTTLLRDLICQLSSKFSWRVSVCDERNEISACWDGKPQFELGPCADVLCGAGKEEGIEMLLRTMNPQWIAVDEITSEKDVDAILRASYCGVRFMATVHAYTSEELFIRPVYRKLMEAGIFQTLITITKDRQLRIKEMDAND